MAEIKGVFKGGGGVQGVYTPTEIVPFLDTPLAEMFCAIPQTNSNIHPA